MIGSTQRPLPDNTQHSQDSLHTTLNETDQVSLSLSLSLTHSHTHTHAHTHAHTRTYTQTERKNYISDSLNPKFFREPREIKIFPTEWYQELPAFNLIFIPSWIKFRFGGVYEEDVFVYWACSEMGHACRHLSWFSTAIIWSSGTTQTLDSVKLITLHSRMRDAVHLDITARPRAYHLPSRRISFRKQNTDRLTENFGCASHSV